MAEKISAPARTIAGLVAIPWSVMLAGLFAPVFYGEWLEWDPAMPIVLVVVTALGYIALVGRFPPG